jgi:hypothetical protein
MVRIHAPEPEPAARPAGEPCLDPGGLAQIRSRSATETPRENRPGPAPAPSSPGTDATNLAPARGSGTIHFESLNHGSNPCAGTRACREASGRALPRPRGSCQDQITIRHRDPTREPAGAGASPVIPGHGRDEPRSRPRQRNHPPPGMRRPARSDSPARARVPDNLRRNPRHARVSLGRGHLAPSAAERPLDPARGCIG